MKFKQNAKMNASGSHYCSGGKVKKMADGGWTSGAKLSKSVQLDAALAKGIADKEVGSTDLINRSPARPINVKSEDLVSRGPAKQIDKNLADRLYRPLKKGGKVKRGCK